MPVSELSFLVVDDQEFHRIVTANLLQDLSAKSVHHCANAKDALQLLKTVSVDVLILDLKLAGMDGLEFIRHVGLSRSSPAVIICSSVEKGVLPCVEAMAAAYGVFVLGCAEKPLTGRRLSELVEHYSPVSVPAMRAIATPASFTPEEIVDALENGQFEPFFQPEIEMKTWRVAGTEALARWRHPQQGLVLPEAFIKPLENAGKIHMLLRSILRQSAQFGRMLRDAGLEHSMSVNLSFESLTDVTLAEQIMTVVASQNIDPGAFVLEVTESAATTEVGRALENLARLRLKGFRLAIDDYGSGVSSIEKLARIPFAEMKIDRPLLLRAGRHESARVVFESSLDMARRLGMTSVAEGVESQAEWDLLLALGCDMAQGDYIAKPMTRAQYLAWARDWPAKVAARSQTV
jgi:EAL domain-containing protein (putative c-di-GMP-specific phosphodiesterase class I)